MRYRLPVNIDKWKAGYIFESIDAIPMIVLERMATCDYMLEPVSSRRQYCELILGDDWTITFDMNATEAGFRATVEAIKALLEYVHEPGGLHKPHTVGDDRDMADLIYKASEARAFIEGGAS